MDKACNFTKNNIPPWVFFTFLKLYKTNGTKSRKASGLLRFSEIIPFKTL